MTTIIDSPAERAAQDSVEGRSSKERPSKQKRFHPDSCGPGGRVDRAPHLDESDRDYA